jgi:transcriptional regulator with XRE-family HTH domain
MNMLKRIKNSPLKKEYTERINNKLTTDWKFALKIFQMELTEEILKELEKRNLSRSDLANNLDVSRSYISQLINGKNNLRLNTLFKLCFELGIVPQISFNSREDLNFEKLQEYKKTKGLKINFSNIETMKINEYEKDTQTK